jgi:prepilin-type N-terminal cleavage/methylation domain-containing protein/prepilin-type processing-associated H-X9-DG protein
MPEVRNMECRKRGREAMATPVVAHRAVRRRTRSWHGFTLIELLVVIAVITILAALVMPALLGSLRQADSASCKSNLREFGQALLMYVNNNALFLPATGPPEWGFPYWYDSLTIYLKDERIYRCAATVGSGVGYGMNNRFVNSGDGTGNFVEADTGIWGTTYGVSIVRNPSGTIVFADAAPVLNPTDEPEDWKEDSHGNVQAYMHFPQTPQFWSGHAVGDNQRAVPRHDGSTNCCFFDGHVQSIKTRDIIDDWRGDPGCRYDNV